jgi:hypothetical protein
MVGVVDLQADRRKGDVPAWPFVEGWGIDQLELPAVRGR